MLLHRVHARRPCHFAIVGSGEERQQAGSLASTLEIADDVRLPGFRDNPFTLVVGRPCWCHFVLVADCTFGSREILDDRRYGILVSAGDVRALATAMGKARWRALRPVRSQDSLGEVLTGCVRSTVFEHARN